MSAQHISLRRDATRLIGTGRYRIEQTADAGGDVVSGEIAAAWDDSLTLRHALSLRDLRQEPTLDLPYVSIARITRLYQ